MEQLLQEVSPNLEIEPWLKSAIWPVAVDSERPLPTQYACAACLTRLFNETTAAPGVRIVRAGVLEGASQWTPRAHIWAKRKQPWIVLPAEAPQWPESPTPEEFAAALF